MNRIKTVFAFVIMRAPVTGPAEAAPVLHLDASEFSSPRGA